jgi:hypothetical protein
VYDSPHIPFHTTYITSVGSIYGVRTHASPSLGPRARGRRAVVVATLRRHGLKERVNALVARMQAVENAYLFAHAMI